MALTGHGLPINQVGAFYVPTFNPVTDDTTTTLRAPVLTRLQNVADHTSLRSTILGCAVALLAVVAPPPFVQNDWPNPPRQRSLIGDQLGYTDSSEYWMLDSAIPIKNNWELPQRQRQRNEFGSTDSYKTLLFAVPPAPFYATDWQNPRGPKTLVGAQHGYIDPSEYWMLDSTIPIKNN